MLVELGPTKKAAAHAAQALGMHPNYGYQLMRDEAVLAALREEATKTLTGAVLLGVNVIIKIAQDNTHKDQYRAAVFLAELNGFTTKRKIVVEHAVERDSETVIRDIRNLAKFSGLDPNAFMRSLGFIGGSGVAPQRNLLS